MPPLIKKGLITTNEKDARGGRTGAKVPQSKFVRWEDVVDAIVPVLHSHDLLLSFQTGQESLDRVSVTAVLSHLDGHSESSQMALPIENSGSKNNAQGWGSSVSYGKRYTAFSLLNLAGQDEDNDGRGAMVDDEQQATLVSRIHEVGTDIDGFLGVLGVESLSDLPATSFRTAMNLLDAKARARMRAGEGAA
jgi:hypothetical protein